MDSELCTGQNALARKGARAVLGCQHRQELKCTREIVSSERVVSAVVSKGNR